MFDYHLPTACCAGSTSKTDQFWFRVSDLMTRICNPDHVLQAFDIRYLSCSHKASHVLHASLANRDSRALAIPNRGRELELIKAVGSWGFCAHDLTDDELVHAAFLMLRHALALPELDNWRLPAGMGTPHGYAMQTMCKDPRDLT